MRDSCLECTIKHLARAEAQMDEVLQGYPLHKYLVWGQLAEASSECLEKYPALANEIRDYRKLYQADETYKFPTMMLLAKLDDLLTEEPEAKEPAASISGLCTCSHTYEKHWEGQGCILCQCLGFHASDVEVARKRADEARKRADEAKKAVEELPSDLPF